LCVSFQ